MIIRTRVKVIQLYRAVYDKTSQRSRTKYLGAVEKDGRPSADLLLRLSEPERRQLEHHLAVRARTLEEGRCRQAFKNAPAELRRIADWLRRQPRSRDVQTRAQELRGAYKDLYDVMRALGISRLRGGSTCGERKMPASGSVAQGASDT